MSGPGGATRPLPPPPLRLRAFNVVWQVVVHLLVPFALLFFLLRSRKEPLYRRHFAHRFGFGPVGPKGAVWVYAASLGETRAVSPLIRDLMARGHRICLTHASPAGLIEGRRLFQDERIVHRYVPFDLFWCIGLFLWRLRPSVGLVVEGEFWPGHLLMAEWFGVPMLHVNGNLHEHSLARARRFGGLRMDILTRFRAVVTKSEDHKARYLKARVEPDRIHVVGELKSDLWIDPAQLEDGARLRADWAPERPVFLIASSVAEEEEALTRIVERLLALSEGPRILWAPRSPQRFAALSEALRQRGIRVARRSEVLGPDRSGRIPDDCDVLVGDSTGEMNVWYRMADLVFVGATLADKGGHNISEPLALARPVVIGPSVYGITYPAHLAEREGAARILADADALAGEVEHLLSDPAALAAFTDRTRDFARRQTGASARTVAIVEAVLAATGRGPRAWAGPPVIMVLSNEMDAKGDPTEVSRERLARAVALLHATPGAVLVTSGWRYRTDTDLSLARGMARAAMRDHAVPAERIVALETARDTVGDALFLRRDLDPVSVTVVTSEYHRARAEEIFRRALRQGADLTVIGTGAPADAGRAAAEAASLKAFRDTFDGVAPGDLPAMLARLHERHPFYNGTRDVQADRRHD